LDQKYGWDQNIVWFIRVYDTKNTEKIVQLEGHSEWVEEIRFSPREKLMATASADVTVIIRDFEKKSI